MSDSKASRKRDAALRTAQGISQVWEDRKTLAKQEMAAQIAASDAKTVRLRAQRLEKEQQDAEAERVAAQSAPPAQSKKRAAKRIIAG